MTDPRNEAQRLSAELEAALCRQLLAEWHEVNYSHFKDALRPPVIALSDGDVRLGRWAREVRTLEIARTLCLSQPWGVVREVLKHEMAHQYVSEVLGRNDETAHGPSFQSVCERLGIDATAAGMPPAAGGSAEEVEERRVLGRIARLLALAESENLHEAELAMNEAQRLMLKYNLEADALPRAGRRAYAFRHLGAVSGRVQESERVLAMLLGKHFFVEVIWVSSYAPLLGMRGRVLEICGTQANLEMAEYVYSFLMRTAERLWQEHKRTRHIRGDRDRRAYLAGVMMGFHEKLSAQGAVNRCEGLVWQGDPGLQGYLRQRHPRIRYTSSSGNGRNEAHHEGRAAGRQIILHKPVSHTGSGGRALPEHGRR